jgi:hypothetical protein
MKTAHGSSMMVRPWSGQTQRTLIKVESGQTTRFNLGGKGCTVVGKAVINGATNPVDWQRDVQTLSTKQPTRPAPKRAEFSSETAFSAAKEEWKAREREFWLSEAGREFQRNDHRYVLVFTNDGSFVVNDVLPGTYELSIRVGDPNEPGVPPFNSQFLGSLQMDVTVPESSSSPEESRLDLGLLELH